jgi:hypothetical protein
MDEVTAILFEPARVLLFPEAAEALKESGEDPYLFLGRHVTGDWGNLSGKETVENFFALASGGEILSRYYTGGGKVLCVATEGDRSKTYLFLKGEEDSMGTDDREPEPIFGSFTSAAGLALGEMLALTGRPERLGECLASIEATAYATLLSSGIEGGAVGGKSLGSAALRVVRVWHEETDNLASLGDAIEALQDVLELMGIRYGTANTGEE